MLFIGCGELACFSFTREVCVCVLEVSGGEGGAVFCRPTCETPAQVSLCVSASARLVRVSL